MMVVEKGVVAVEIGKRFVVQNFHRFAIAGHRVIQTEYLASMAVDDIQVVRNKNDGYFQSILEMVKKIVNGFLPDYVHVLGRFVEEEHLRLVDNRPGEQYFLELAARKSRQIFSEPVPVYLDEF